MDRISDSGSDGCGSIPHGGTKRGFGPFLCTLSTPSHFVTAPVGRRCLFAPLIQPAEIFPMPEKGILRFQDPMILIREDKQS